MDLWIIFPIIKLKDTIYRNQILKNFSPNFIPSLKNPKFPLKKVNNLMDPGHGLWMPTIH